ncbi:hypothetical protein M218_25590 [Burkholderia pseudomallei MSHR338]|nr:hypothetical protein BPC006_II2432 [Burkholderia pseudomallei BPC006]EMP73716.1 hypothetical protein D512_27483 [Burkholderia pseudomallei MSHR1043]EQA86114.1 hypothetical protein M218_25590 [Burkholderia pseudomallei MSHR338]
MAQRENVTIIAATRRNSGAFFHPTFDRFGE